MMLALVRWLHLLPLMAVFGASAFHFILRRNKLDADPESRLWFAASLTALITAFAKLLLVTASAAGTLDLTSLAAVLQNTLFGHVFVFRAAALLALTAATIPRKPYPPLVAVLSGAALAAVALTSHAAADGRADYASLRAANDAIHLLAGGFWIGGLVVLLQLALACTDRSASLLAPLAVFSEWAIYAVTVLILAGMINAAFIYAAEHVSWTYTILLLLKASLAFAMIVIAFINRLRLMPRLEAGSSAVTLARNIRTELALAGAVVALAAILGSISPG